MRITIICVGKVKEKFFADAIKEYSKRLSRYCKLEIREVEDEKTPEGASDTVVQQIKDKEGERVERVIPENAYVIALAIEGKKLTSEKMARKIRDLGIAGKSHVVFLIGGSLGMSDQLLSGADYLLSFSDMTFPHQLMRVILLEQIYRSFRIINGEPYHK